MGESYLVLAGMTEANRALELRIRNDGVGEWVDKVDGSSVRHATDAEVDRARSEFWGLPQ